MANRNLQITNGRWAAAIAGLVCLATLDRAIQATTASSSRVSPWWKDMAQNYWSPQNAVGELVGRDAADCGQFGPEVTKAQLTSAIGCARAVAGDHKSFFAIRHSLGPEERVSGSFESQRWLAEGIFGAADGVVRRFDYEGFFINVLYDVWPPPKPTLKESPCSSPHALRDASGAVRFACASQSRHETGERAR